MSKWSVYYQDRACNKKYLNYFKKRYAAFLDLITSIAGVTESPIIELGAGIGTVVKVLSKDARLKDWSFLTIEKDLDMHKLLEINLNKIWNSCNINNDLFNFNSHMYNQKALITSHGVLEHFSNKQLSKFDKIYGKFKQVHYVPGNKYKYQSFGDERLLPIRFWEDLGFDVNTFNDSYDYILTKNI